MNISIRWKLFASFLLLTTATVGALLLYLGPELERHLVSDLTEHLFSQARIAALTASSSAGELTRNGPSLAAEIGRRSSARVTIIAPDGVVVGDSELPGNRLAEMENHRDRPEVIQALQEGRGSSVRYSTTLQSEMLYVAAPIPLQSGGSGALRLALPLTSVEYLKKGLHATLGMALLITIVVSLALSSLLSRLVYRPLQQISQLARDIGTGRFTRRMEIRRNDEFGSLAQVMNDMAERLQEHIRSLASERNRLDTILRGMGEGVMVTDSDGTVTLVNPAFCSLFGVPEQITGRPLIEISRHPALHESFRSTVSTRGEYLEELAIDTPGERVALTHWAPLLSGNELKGVVAVFHDITDLKRLETVRKDFVANVSHELRTPVTVIRGYAETLLAGLMAEDPERAHQFLSVILTHSERLTVLISDLLSLSEMESGNFRLKLAPIPLAATVRHAAALLEMKSAGKKIAIRLGDMDEGVYVMADQGRIEQVFINLLDNAVKYTPSGGTVSIEMAVNADTATVTVSDTGPGIPLHSLPRIFERFYRVDAARSREQGGTGLGLAIVKHIVQLHGGSVSVASPPGKGASFSVSLRKHS